MSIPVVIALGGNLGDVRATGEVALAQLNNTPGLEVQRTSQWYSTEPVGCDGRFLNAAALLHSELPPTQLLRRLLEIETEHGRVRTGHWTPRPLDLDLVLFGQWQVADPRLKLPHPAAWCRRFVLDPACEVAGQLVHPDFSLTLRQLRDRLLARPLVVAWEAELPLEAVIAGPVQSRFGAQVRWVKAAEPAIVRFVAPTTIPRGQFAVALSPDLVEARRIVIETLTSLLDEPQVSS